MSDNHESEKAEIYINGFVFVGRPDDLQKVLDFIRSLGDHVKPLGNYGTFILISSETGDVEKVDFRPRK